MTSLFGEAATSAPAGPRRAGATEAPTAPGRRRRRTGGRRGRAPPDVQALIDQAARDLADYQRLTAEGKLGEAGQRLESLKQMLEQLKKER